MNNAKVNKYIPDDDLLNVYLNQDENFDHCMLLDKNVIIVIADKIIDNTNVAIPLCFFLSFVFAIIFCINFLSYLNSGGLSGTYIGFAPVRIVSAP